MHISKTIFGNNMLTFKDKLKRFQNAFTIVRKELFCLKQQEQQKHT